MKVGILAENNDFVIFKLCSFGCSVCLGTTSTTTKVKSAYEPSGASGSSLSWFLWHEATRSISTPHWMGCYVIAGLPPALNSLVPFYSEDTRTVNTCYFLYIFV